MLEGCANGKKSQIVQSMLPISKAKNLGFQILIIYKFLRFSCLIGKFLTAMVTNNIRVYLFD